MIRVIDTSLANLEAATTNGVKALALATKKSKQSATEGKRLNRKRVALIKRRIAAGKKAYDLGKGTHCSKEKEGIESRL